MDKKPHKPTGNRTEVRSLVSRLYDAQRETTRRVQESADFEKLSFSSPDGFTVNDVLRMWGWHFWSHHRDLVRARGELVDDDPHFHVPHHVRFAYEEFGRFVGELSCLSDEYLNARPPDGGRTIRENVEHVIASLETRIPGEIERATPADSEKSTGAKDAT